MQVNDDCPQWDIRINRRSLTKGTQISSNDLKARL